MTATCERPPKGWECTRATGHQGPCAATPQPLTVGDLIAMANLPGGANDQLRAARAELDVFANCRDCGAWPSHAPSCPRSRFRGGVMTIDSATRTEAQDALAEYADQLACGEPEENHARLAAALTALIAEEES